MERCSVAALVMMAMMALAGCQGSPPPPAKDSGPSSDLPDPLQMVGQERPPLPARVHLSYTVTPDKEVLVLRGKTNLADGAEVKTTLWGGKEFESAIRSTELVTVKGGAFEARLRAPYPFRYTIYAIVELMGDSRDQALRRQTAGLTMERDGSLYSLLARQDLARRDPFSREWMKREMGEMRAAWTTAVEFYDRLDQLLGRFKAKKASCIPCELRTFTAEHRKATREGRITVSGLCSNRPFNDQCEWVAQAMESVRDFLDKVSPEDGSLAAEEYGLLKERRGLLRKVELFLKRAAASGY